MAGTALLASTQSESRLNIPNFASTTAPNKNDGQLSQSRRSTFVAQYVNKFTTKQSHVCGSNTRDIQYE